MLKRLAAILTAWMLGWIVYTIAMVLTVYDGLLSLIFQPIMGAAFSTLVVGFSLVVGLIFRLPVIGRVWRAIGFVVPFLVVASIVVMCFGEQWGLTQTYTDFETGRQFVGLRSEVAITCYVVMIFGVANWPLKPKHAD